MPDAKDEIAALAIKCMALGERRCREAIERQIASAQERGRWAEMGKWHRVRLRAQRLAHEQALSRDQRPCLGVRRAMAAARVTPAPA